MIDSSFSGLDNLSSIDFLEALYEDYLRNPSQVPEGWRTAFGRIRGGDGERTHQEVRRAFAESARREHLLGGIGTAALPDSVPYHKQRGVLRLIRSYRLTGHLAADLDPIRLRPPRVVPNLDLSFHGLDASDLETVFDAGTLVGLDQAPLREIEARLKATYSGRVAVEHMHINNVEQETWLHERLEGTCSRADLSDAEKRRALEILVGAEGLEKYLHTRFSGQKRFGLEGGECLLVALHELVESSGRHGIEEIALGMAHRGRLNVLINLMGKRPSDLFQEFEHKTELSELYMGDVKYHQGFAVDLLTGGGPLHLALAFNPSHLEIIGPVVLGSVRARQDRRSETRHDQVMGVIIHGDAAFAGQGVVYETLQLAYTRGYSTGGTIHVVVNNQIGFTTSHPLDTRSTPYCTDIGKVTASPIIHVNGDDPEAVIFATRLAMDFRMKFHKDVVLDLVCYRRHGHNEADEPAATQPMMYRKIRSHPTPVEVYGRTLAEEGRVSAEELARMQETYRDHLEHGESLISNAWPDQKYLYRYVSDWSPFLERRWDEPAETGLPAERLKRIGDRITRIPDDLELHPRVAKVMEDRRKMLAGGLPLDWGAAETMAYATLLDEGYHVRVSGQDTGRGTFFHRHAVLHNQRDGSGYIPLHHLGQKQGRFTIIDSILSEEAVVAFEYGYSATVPDTLIVWEAQFGDFVNNAQVVIDQFISSSEQKWRRLSGLVLMLPHGWEGQGPEHSSARLERFLELCAQENMQVAVPSTPAQMFHLLRRELVRPYRKPLVIMSPKSMLRRKTSFSDLDDLAAPEFQLVIDEADPIDPAQVDRVLICAGKVYYDILEARREKDETRVAILRIEQLYPFPERWIADLLARYPNAREVVWTQEESRNMGAWPFLSHHLPRCLRPGQTLRYAGRPASASPAVGDLQKHLRQQQRVVETVLRFGPTATQHVDVIPPAAEPLPEPSPGAPPA